MLGPIVRHSDTTSSSAKSRGTRIGYTRVSTVAQTLDQQNEALASAGVTKVFSDVMSGARDDRPGLAALMEYVREGDTVVVWKLDRLGRNMLHILQTVKKLTDRGVTLVSVTDGIDSSTPAGRMMIGVLGSLADYERGLSWDRVDLDAGTLKVAVTIARVNGRLTITEPKTDRARRTIPLSPAVVALLRKHKAAQAAEKLRAGGQWQDCGLVFTTELGTPVDPRNLLRLIEGAAKAAGVEGVGIHTLRHSAAVRWLERGVHIKAVADLPGHSSIAITGDVYGHTSDDTARTAVDGLSSDLGL